MNTITKDQTVKIIGPQPPECPQAGAVGTVVKVYPVLCMALVKFTDHQDDPVLATDELPTAYGYMLHDLTPVMENN